MARPSTRGVRLKDGFYIEVRNKGAQSGIKIHRDSYEAAQMALNSYGKMHDVQYVGQVENGKIVNPNKPSKKK